VTNSTTKVEYIAASESVKEGVGAKIGFSHQQSRGLSEGVQELLP